MERAGRARGYAGCTGCDERLNSPAGKAAAGPNDPGYAVYDLYDLGEFEQKGATRTAIDCNADADTERKIYLLAGKSFSGDVSFEQGNFDFLMGCDVDTYHEEVHNDLVQYGRRFVDTTNVDGFRLDALKHLPATFIKDS